MLQDEMAKRIKVRKANNPWKGLKQVTIIIFFILSFSQEGKQSLEGFETELPSVVLPDQSRSGRQTIPGRV